MSEKVTVVVEFDTDNSKHGTTIKSVTTYTPVKGTAADMTIVGTAIMTLGTDFIAAAFGEAMKLSECKCPNCTEKVRRCLGEMAADTTVFMDKHSHDDNFYRVITREYTNLEPGV